MKKFLVLMFLAVCGTGSAFSQLRVANNFGQTLNVETGGGKTISIPDKGVAVFPVRVRVATLSCQTPDNRIKFFVSRKVSRSGLVEILSGDNIGAMPMVKQKDSIILVSDKPDTVAVTEGPSLDDIVKGKVEVAVSDSNVISQAPSIRQIKIKYSGAFDPRILLGEGQGAKLLEFDSIDNSGAKTCILNAQKDSDLLINFVLKDDKNPSQIIWPYVKITRHLDDSVCKITDFDIESLVFPETKKVRLKFESENCRLIIKSKKDRLIFLGYQETSGPIALPIGKSYIEAAYIDSKDCFHPKVWLPICVASGDKIITITATDLAKSVIIKN